MKHCSLLHKRKRTERGKKNYISRLASHIFFKIIVAEARKPYKKVDVIHVALVFFYQCLLFLKN